MGCTQDTIAPGPLFTALGWDGLAPDSAFSALPPVVGRRLSVAAGEVHEHCGGSDLFLVTAEPADPSLPDAVRTTLSGVGPGCAVAARGLPELVGGWVAMPGLDIKVTAAGDLGDDPVVAVSPADAVGLLTAAGGGRLLVRTVVVVRGPLGTGHPGGRRAAELAGWDVFADGVAQVPLLPAHDHGAGCVA